MDATQTGATQALERPKMAKRRADKPELVSVKLPADVMESARIVAAYTGETIAEMLGDMLRPLLAKKEKEEAARRAGAAEAPKKGRPKH